MKSAESSSNNTVAAAFLSRLLKASNSFVVAIQVIAGCILMSLGFSAEEYTELSLATTGAANPPFGSSLLGLVLTPWFGILAAVLTVATVVKEFFIKTLKLRVKLNILLLILLILFLGLVLPALYQPV